MPSGVFEPAGQGDDDVIKDDAELARDVQKVAGLTHKDAVNDPGGIKKLLAKIEDNIQRGKARDAARAARQAGKGGGGKKGK